MKRNIIAPVVISLVIVGAGVGVYSLLPKTHQATTVFGHAALVEFNKAELVKSSTVVVLATVMESQSGKYPSKITAGKEDIITTVTLGVEKYLHNPENITSRTLTVQTLGGSVGDTRMIVEGAPSFRVGDRILVFLVRDTSGAFTVNGWVQGKYTVDANGEIGVGEDEIVNLNRIFGGSRLVSDMENGIKSASMLPAVAGGKTPAVLSLPSKNANAEAQSVLDSAAVR